MRILITSLLILFAIGTIDFEPLGMIRFNEVVSPGEELVVRVNILNLGDEDLDKIQVSAYIPELGLFTRSSRFDLDDNEKLAKVVFFDIPFGTPAGVYLLQISAHGENDVRFRSREFRYVYVT